MDEHEREQPSERRTAMDYAKAADEVIGLVSNIVAAAAKKDPRLQPLLKALRSAQPLVRQFSKVLPVVAPVAEPVIAAAQRGAQAVGKRLPEAAAGKAAQVRQAAGKAAEGIRSGGASAKEAVMAPVRGALERSRREKARMAARKTLLEGAIKAVSAKAFLEAWEANDSLGLQAGVPLFDYAGCYAILAFDRKVHSKDYCRYRDVYVGKARHMGKGVHADLTGSGNPDVYADVKFKRPVYVLLYPCEESRLDELEASLIVALDADDSYNRLGNRIEAAGGHEQRNSEAQSAQG